ncbi:MAG: DUF1492 domain-containing protein [Eubacterium sp.]|nr:DUF1492 domain-containing protein [Eubacterium sp.]
MTAKEFLSRAYRLEQKIKVLTQELSELRELSMSISSPGFEEHYSATRNTDAPFVHALEKIEEREKEIADKVVALLEIKKEISDVISRVANVDQRLVLHYRYVENRSWYKIGIEMNVDESTVRRWHNKALAQIKIPTEK